VKEKSRNSYTGSSKLCAYILMLFCSSKSSESFWQFRTTCSRVEWKTFLHVCPSYSFL